MVAPAIMPWLMRMPRLKILVHGVEHRFAQIVALQQMAAAYGRLGHEPATPPIQDFCMIVCNVFQEKCPSNFAGR